MLDGPVLDMHVGLWNREGVDIGRIKVTETVTVIEEAVGGLVGDSERTAENVLYRHVLCKASATFV